MPDDVRLIEELAANAWPAYVQQAVDGWLLRLTPGVRARRSSSVLPNDGPGRVPLENKLELVEAFYRRRGVPARYQVSPAAVPGDLDATLEARGYEIETPVSVQVAELEPLVSGVADRGEASARVSGEPGTAWLGTWTEVFRRGDSETARRRILDRIAPPAGFASLEIGRRVAAVGMGVVERGWLGVFAMGTLPEFRRRGAATVILEALARWGHDQGATHAYLQVEREHEAATRLYASSGFETAYGYHYRTRPSA
jgi:GNAT superfamily N-acetyltransferase